MGVIKCDKVQAVAERETAIGPAPPCDQWKQIQMQSKASASFPNQKDWRNHDGVNMFQSELNMQLLL